MGEVGRLGGWAVYSMRSCPLLECARGRGRKEDKKEIYRMAYWRGMKSLPFHSNSNCWRVKRCGT